MVYRFVDRDFTETSASEAEGKGPHDPLSTTFKSLPSLQTPLFCGAHVVEKQTPQQCLDECVDYIKRNKVFGDVAIEFIGLDLEMTGLTKEKPGIKKDLEMNHYYKQQMEGAASFGIIQLGVCLVGRRPNTDSSECNDGWLVRPYNFYLYPKRRRVVLSDTTSFKFLHESGFSFDSWISFGLDYETMNDITIDQTLSKDRRVIPEEVIGTGVQRIIEAIMTNATPLVLHNGLLDLLHIVDKFVVRLEHNSETIEDFSELIHKYFPGGVFDTKYIAKKLMKGVPDGYTENAITALAILANELDREPSISIEMAGNLSGVYSKGDAKLHEAGYDAMLTAKVFLLQLCSLKDHTDTHICRSAEASTCHYCLANGICKDWLHGSRACGWWNTLDSIIGTEGIAIRKKASTNTQANVLRAKRGTLYIGSNYPKK